MGNPLSSWIWTSTPLDSVQSPSVSYLNPVPKYTEEEQRNEQMLGPRNHVPSSSGSSVYADKYEGTVITSIRATDITPGLSKRIPSGFYITVQHSGLEWRTESRRLSVNDESDVIDWSGPIPIPSDLCATICLGMYASFEFQPMLGNGELLQELTVTVEQLLDSSAKDLPFTFPNEDAAPPYSSLLVTVGRWKHENNDSSASRVLCPHRSVTECQGELEKLTDDGHKALSRYRKNGGKRDLERSIELFERALKICPLDHPCRAAAQSNLAMPRFLLCQADDSNGSLDLPLALYRDALSARSGDHPDRPSTLIQLAAVHVARFEKQQHEADSAQAEALLHEAMNLSFTDSYENLAANTMLQLLAEYKTDPVQGGSRFSVGRDSTSDLTDGDPWTSHVRLLERYKQFGDLDDLQHAISQLEALLGSTTVRDRRYPGALTNYGVALLQRYRHFNKLHDLEEEISKFSEAVDLTPDGYPYKFRHLNNLGNAFLTRFERLGELRNLEQAISNFRDAVDITPHDHPDQPRHLNNLGNSCLTRFDRLGELSDLEEAISQLKAADELTPYRHPCKPNYSHNLGNSFHSRFERLGELCDLEQAILHLRTAVDLTPFGDPNKPRRLCDLGNTLLTQFHRLGELGDLEQAASMFKDAVNITPRDHPDQPRHLNNLGDSFLTRFECFGELANLEQAISVFRDLATHSNPHRLASLNNLGNSLLTCFKQHGELGDLEQAISRFEEAVDLMPNSHRYKSAYLNNLGSSLIDRFHRLQDLGDLAQAISRLEDAAGLVPDGHPDEFISLNTLGTAFLARFKHLGDISDLERAISKFTHVIHLVPDGHPHKRGCLNNLGACHLSQFERFGELSDLALAISSQRRAVELTPNGHPDKPGSLNDLGNSLHTRFDHFGELGDLEQAILIFKDTVALTPHNHPGKPGYLNSLGNCFLGRFERLGQLSDLEQAISMLEDVVNLTPDGHLEKPARLSSLGRSLTARFHRFGELSELEQAISRFRRAVDLTPEGYPAKWTYLNNLGTSFWTRYEQLGQPDDLEQALSRLGDAIYLIPNGHPGKPICLNNLASAFAARFLRLKGPHDLEQAIMTLEEAVYLIPDGHPQKPGCLHNLGLAFSFRFDHFGGLGDLEKAVLMQAKAASLTPDDDPHRYHCLNNLGSSLRARFERFGELSALEQAISKLGEALDLIPDGHPEQPIILNNLAQSFRARFEHLQERSDLEQAISLYSCSAFAPSGHVLARFHASLQWIACARVIGHHTLLPAYSIAIRSIPQAAWIGFSLTYRYRELTRAADVVREAAAAALDSGLPETAVEWLEQGRSIVWGQLFQLRSSYEELSAVYPEHARRLQELSTALAQAGVAREKALSSLSGFIRQAEYAVTESLEQEANKQRTLAIERDKLLQEIRQLPGFERFLLHKEFSQLRTSAHSGPVVILNVAESRCDALIVLADVENVIHVPLPKITLGRLVDLQSTMKGLVRHARVMPDDERDGQRMLQKHNNQWESILSTLWKSVAKPVLDSLAFSTPGNLSRIFWCPTGPFAFLPIHAAGLYDAQHSQPGHKLSDFVISSYVPTLSILPPSPQFGPAESGDLRFLAVRQPPSDGLLQLPGVDAELKHIRAVIRDSPSRTMLLESSLGTVEEVLDLMKEADWVHFACHGIQDTDNPTDSGLCLADGQRLKLSDMIALSRPRGGLAFLSACQTATGEKVLSDEAIHIAASMLFVGYGGVIGTMWSINDWMAPRVAKDVYEQLFRDGARPDYREAARALQGAVGRLRESGVSFDEWLPFIHVGL